ncbi:hypothetical protein ACFQ2B_32370 [Streptomyces stramineus]
MRHAAAGSAMALVAGLALVAGTAGQATAIPAAAGAKAAESCDSGRNTAASAAADTARTDAPARATAGTTAQKLSYHLPAQAPIGLWTQSSSPCAHRSPRAPCAWTSAAGASAPTPCWCSATSPRPAAGPT